MKKNIGVLCAIVSLFLLYAPRQVCAGGEILSSGGNVYSSILHKEFEEDKYNGKSKLRWILIQTNVPYFDLPLDPKNFHKKTCNAFLKNGWEYFLLSRDEYFVYRNAINLGNEIYVYRKQPKTYKHKAKTIVNYAFKVRPDIETNFFEKRKLSFFVTIPEVDSSSMWNTEKYRGEDLEIFFYKKVFEKYENALKENNRYK